MVEKTHVKLGVYKHARDNTGVQRARGRRYRGSSPPPGTLSIKCDESGRGVVVEPALHLRQRRNSEIPYQAPTIKANIQNATTKLNK